MRSSMFVVLSIFVHGLCVAAIAVSPKQVAPAAGNSEVEVQIGTPAESPGVQEAPPQAEQPAPAPEPVKVASTATRKTRVIKAPMEKVTALPAKETPVKEQAAVKDDSLDPQIEEMTPVAPVIKAAASEETPEFKPVKESIGGVESDKAEPATEEQEATPAATGTGTNEEAEMAKGGATQAGAVSYLDLKQAQGNKAPQYPLQARKENRQGQVELVYRVTNDGHVTDLQVAKSSGFKDLDQEAARAVAQFKFVAGQEGWARHPVTFALKGQTAQLPGRLRSANAN